MPTRPIRSLAEKRRGRRSAAHVYAGVHTPLVLRRMMRAGQIIDGEVGISRFPVSIRRELSVRSPRSPDRRGTIARGTQSFLLSLASGARINGCPSRYSRWFPDIAHPATVAVDAIPRPMIGERSPRRTVCRSTRATIIGDFDRVVGSRSRPALINIEHIRRLPSASNARINGCSTTAGMKRRLAIDAFRDSECGG